MSKILTISILFLVLFPAVTFGGETAVGGQFPADFAEKAFAHIDQLARFGPRARGTEGEKRALEYIREQAEKTGLQVRVEHFDYETFKVEKFDFTICGENIEVETVGFDPYGGTFDCSGTPVFVGPDRSADALNQLEINEQIVVTTAPVDYFNLIFRGPQLVVYVSNSDFEILAAKACSACELEIKGSFETQTSANVVAEIPSNIRPDREVVLTAHWDSYRDSPGADDNGSGVGVLIELARFFSDFERDVGGNIKCVWFGAEELGLVGSRAYLNAHQEDLKNCVLLFNMDNIGGPVGPMVEMLGGVSGIPEQKGNSQFPLRIRGRALEGPDGRWRMLGPDLIRTFMVTNHPAWFVEVIEASADHLGYEVTPRGNLGSDQQVFTQAGIVATSIGTSGNQYHVPADIPAQIHKDKLEIAGKLVANVVLTSLFYFDNKQD